MAHPGVLPMFLPFTLLLLAARNVLGQAPTATPTPTPTPTPCVFSSATPVPVTSCGSITANAVITRDLVATSTDVNRPCLNVLADGVSVDGDSHTISAPTFAVLIADHGCVTIHDVISSSGVWVRGTTAGQNTIQRSKLGEVWIQNGDRNVITDNLLTELTITGDDNDPAQAQTITHNYIIGSDRDLVKISTADQPAQCPRADHDIRGNSIIGTAPFTTVEPMEQILFYYRCGSDSTIADNLIRATGLARGMQFRDEADGNLIQNNDVWVHKSNAGALFILSGNSNKHHPRDNTFEHNRFRADAGPAIFIQATGAENNTFQGNLFWSDQIEAGRIAGVKGNVFDHNTFKGEAGTLLVLENLDDPSANNSYLSNIFAHAGEYIFKAGSAGIQNHLGNFNVFFNSTGEAQFRIEAQTFDLAGWQSQTQQDANSVEGDPQFLSPVAGDFRIGATSAARGAGESGTDAGACPYGTSNPDCPLFTPTPTPTPTP